MLTTIVIITINQKNSVLCIFVGLELATKTRRTKTFLMKSIKTAIMMVQKETSTQNFLT